MIPNVHLGTLASGFLITIIGAVLLTEGVGWWELHRADLPYLFPVIVILIGAIVVVGAFSDPIDPGDHSG